MLEETHFPAMHPKCCRVPGDDVVSDLVAFDVDGDALTADEIADIVAALLAADEPAVFDQPV